MMTETATVDFCSDCVKRGTCLTRKELNTAKAVEQACFSTSLDYSISNCKEKLTTEDLKTAACKEESKIGQEIIDKLGKKSTS